MRCFVAIAVLVGFGQVTWAGETHAYRAARLWPGDGPVVVDAVLVVRDGKVVAAGRSADVKLPDDAIVHQLGDATLIPGLVIAETNLAERGRDDLLAITPHYRAVDAFDPYADYSRVLAGGVTTVQLSPGNKRLLPGQGSVVKIAGDNVVKRTLRDEESLRIVLGDAFKNPPRVYEPPVGAVSVDRPLEPTKPQLAGSLPSALAGLRAAFHAAKNSADTTDPALRAIADAGSTRKPVRVYAPGAADVHAALELAREFDIKLIFVEPALVSVERLKSWKARVTGVVIGPGVRPGGVSEGESVVVTARRRRSPAAPAKTGKSPPNEDDSTPATLIETIKELQTANIPVALKTMQDADLREALYLGGLFTNQLTTAESLRMLTADAAALLGVGDRVGSLTVGKDADFVVLSGDPFDLHTRIRSVYVEGKSVLDAAARSPIKVLHAGRILTGSGESMAGGSILIEGKSIRAVGREVAVPADADESRYANAVIVPGFLDLANGMGVGGPLNSAVPLSTKLGARLSATDPSAAGVRQSGITTVLLASDTAGLTPVLAFKLADRLRPLKDPAAIKVTLRGNLTPAGPQLRDSLRTGKAYFDSWVKYEADMAEFDRKKKEYDARPKPPEKKPEEKKAEDEKKVEEKKPEEKKPEEKKSDEPKPPSKPQVVETLEPLREMFAGRLPVMIDARREDAIRLAVTICRDEFSLPTVLITAEDAWRVTDLLDSKKVSVVVGPQLVRTVERNDVNLPLSLSLRGVPFGFQSQSVAGAKQLPLAVGFAVRKGLGADEALKGLTSSPARFLKLESIGELAAGKDADLVVLSGMPFELSTRVLAVMIDGQWVYRESE